MINLGVLASGRGSNFQSIIDEIEGGKLNASIKVLITDKPDAFAIERAKKHNIKHLYMNPKDYTSKDSFFEAIAEELLNNQVELVILAGFMRIVAKPLIDAYPMKIMNIHPALLPSFTGLHGQRKAVQYSVKISGCSVHFVDEGMDTGPVIIQAAVCAHHDDTEESLSERILQLEHKIYPEAIRLFEQGRIKVQGRIVVIEDYKKSDCGYLINPPIQI
ncbi:MAG: phosphoribosylglycinamide formyltransferase [Thermodesulfovibrionales bacterium]|nr:phosphoribosylglycinamide formyltransferase [Thermodesulfovibrionales bacterium]